MTADATRDAKTPSVSHSSAYRPLKTLSHEIRILQFVSLQPLRCTFTYTSLIDESPAKYDAVSWSWGDARNRAQIEVDGILVDIPANAYEVIQRLCIAHRRHRVWIDAVCINQNDIGERSHQVSIMSEIYAMAHKTLVWLGEDDGLTERAIVAIQAIDEWRAVRHQDTAHSMCGSLCDHMVDDPFLVNMDWDALLAYYSCSWFQRFWVIQEVALSKHADVFRGMHRICWEIVGRVANYLVVNVFYQDKADKHGIVGVFNAQAIGRVAQGVKADILLIEGRRFEATDPKDRAFALYGLLGRDKELVALKEAFLPDYSKSLVQVYAHVTKAAMLDDPNRIALLLGAQRAVARLDAPEIADTFPSWVPRYDYIETYKRGTHAGVHCPTNVKVCLSTQAKFRSSPLTELHLAGVVVDTIAETCGTVLADGLYTEEPEHEDILTPLFATLTGFWESITGRNPNTPHTQLVKLLRTTLSAGSRVIATGDQTEADWARDFRAFIRLYWPEPKPPFEISRICTNEQLDDEESYVDRDHYGDVEEDNWDISDSDEGLSADGDYAEPASDDDAIEDSDDELPNIKPSTTTLKPALLDDDRAHALAYMRDVLENAVNRQYFVAASGRLGSAARHAQAGDVIAIIFGLPLPVLLRPHGEKWTFVGDVYLNGIMKGEHIKKLQDDGILDDAEQWLIVV